MGADRIVYIRTDGNSNIAAGHLVRCLSIARNCLKLDMPVCFLLSDEESKALLEAFLTEELKQDKHFFVKILKTAKYDDLEQELPEILDLLTAESSPFTDNHQREIIYLLDSYFVTENYLSQIRTAAKIVYIDDLQLFDYPVDLVINYDVIPEASMSAYRAAYQRAGRTLLGASYTPLRSQFENRAITVKETVSDILVTTGGSDPYHFCVEFIRQYANHSPALPTLHVVIGSLSRDKDELYALSKEHSFLRLYENVTDMASLMSKCDLAVSAAGTTLYELCALGIPAISFTMADNQLTAARAFDATGTIPCSGDIRTENMFLHIFSFLSEMSGGSSTVSKEGADGYENRLKTHKAMRKLIDGRGSKHIAAEIARL